eukprot:7090260-Pyramimonas_sp.AAC.1
MDASWGHLGGDRSKERGSLIRAPSGTSRIASWAPIGALLERSWALLGSSWGSLGPLLGLSWALLEQP